MLKLKDKYKDLYLTQGEESEEAKACAEEIKKLSEELKNNSDKLKEADKAADDYDVSIKDVGEEAEKSQGKLKKVFSTIGSGAIKLGKTIGVGLVAGTTAMTGLTVKALNMSGELEQNLGGSEAVFKNFAGKMQEIGKTAFKDMGLSSSDFLATANKMGALFQGAGFGIEESADLSSKAMQRASDVASIMGIDTKDAMEAVAGAAKGNFTMINKSVRYDSDIIVCVGERYQRCA